MNHAVVNNKGQVLDVFATHEEAVEEADRINAENLADVFAWTVETNKQTPDDMPGKGVFW